MANYNKGQRRGHCGDSIAVSGQGMIGDIYDTWGYFEAFGSVRNDSAYTINNVQLQINYKNGNGTIIDSETIVVSGPLNPGVTKTWSRSVRMTLLNGANGLIRIWE